MTSENDDLDLAKTRLGLVLRGKYRLDSVLGVGGMAAVYVATHRNQKQFAVKVLHPEISRNADIRARFVREGYAANSVGHPGAVAVLDDDTAEDGSAFLVMELLEGAPVESLWEKRGNRLSMAEVLAIAAQLTGVLAAAHAKSIVHRDVKPANLFLTNDTQLKVLDFGIARVRDAASQSARMTATGALLGTPAFMPPEQALGNMNELDGQSDLWAVGATMFTLFSGRFVHDADNAQKLMILAATTPPRSVAAVAPDAHAPFAAVVDRALAFNKSDRFANAGEMKAAIEEAYRAIYQRPLGPDALFSLAGRQQNVNDSFAAGATHLAAFTPSSPPPAMQPVSNPPPAMANATVAAMSATRVETSPNAGRSRGPLLALLSVLIVAGIAGGGLFVVKRIRGAKTDVQTALQQESTHVAATTLPPLTALPSSASQAEIATPPPTSGSIGASSASAGSLSGAPATSAPAIADPAKKPAIGTKPSNAANPKPHAAKKDCDPNYTLDSDGNKHFKPECF